MKTKIFIILSLVLFTLSCEERLEEEVYSIQTPDNYYNTPSEGYAGLNAIWGKMNESFGYTQSNLVRLSEALTDNHGGPGWARLFDANINEFQHATFDAKNPYVAGVYSGFYQMIFRANSFIDFMEEKDWGEDEPIRKKQIAEAKLYRGLSYFYLVRYFGGLQIATKISDYEEITGQPRASVEEVYDQIIADLKAAQEGLPGRSEQPAGRPFKEVATGFLAKVYLTMGGQPLEQTEMFAQAATEAEKVIDNEEDYPLFDSYTEAFSEAAQNSGEQMFAIQTYGPGGGFWYPSNKRLPFTPYCVDFVQAFSPDDQRKEVTFWPFFDYGKPVDVDTVEVGQEADDKLFCGKYRTDPNFVDDKPNWPVLRYAEVLLIHAEAENEVNGPTNAAYASINKVRDRAGLDDLSGLTKEQFRDSIKHERRLELSMELKRWFDLVRWGDLIERRNMIYEQRGEPYRLQEKHKLYPIPQDEIQRNPGMTQNPGWE